MLEQNPWMPFLDDAPVALERAAIGLLAAIVISLVAKRAESLSASGALAAILVGAASAAAGWAFGSLLIIYFLAATTISRFRRADKVRLAGSVVSKGDTRDATQVLANGGVYAASALLTLVGSSRFGTAMTLAALGALAASLADTWATEIGILFGGTPRSLLSLRPVPPGTSGGVSVAGLLAMIAGSTLIALLGAALGLSSTVFIVTAAGIAGTLTDSLLGATLQERRWCPVCRRASERRVHVCGTATSLSGGHEWMDNDLVNLIATAAGAAVAALLATL